MSFHQPFLRGRFLLRRTASVGAMIAVLPLLGCGSIEGAYDYSGRARNMALQARAETKPKSDVAESYGTLPTSASLVPGGTQRTPLAPIPAPASQPEIRTAQAQPPSGGYVLGSVRTRAPKESSRLPDEDPRGVRQADSYGQRPQAQGYEREYEAEAPDPRGGYVQEPRYDRGAPQPGGYYVVQPGDTLYGIAERNGVSVEELASVNGLTGHTIYSGQQLRLGGAAAPRYEGRPYREAQPEPRSYREPVEERAAPYQGGRDARGGDYRAQPPIAGVYQPRYEEAERYPPRAPYQQPYREEPRQQQQQQAAPERYYDTAPRGGYQQRQPDFTASNGGGFTPDGPFEPSPDAPWRGESEWRRIKPRVAERPDAYEPQFETEPRASRRSEPQPRVYDARPQYPAQQAPAPAPYAARESYPAPRGGKSEAGFAYTVRRGDTLHEIARRNGIDPRELAEANGLAGDARVIAGQTLRIPRGQSYDWSHPRQEGASQVAPARPRAAAEAVKPAPTKDTRQAAHPAPLVPAETAKPQPQLRPAKAVAEPTPRRPAERTVVVTEVVQENAPPTRAPAAQEMPAAQSLAPRAPAPQPEHREAAEEVILTDPAQATATAATVSANAAVERSSVRECEAALASPEPRSAKTFRMPVQGMVTTKFGSQPDGSFNDGINFSVPKGTPVKAAENGVVAYAGDELAGFGNLVLVRHADGYVTAYAHNDELLVRKCDVIKRGQIISKAGASGKATSPLLHFELRKDSKPMDPDGHFSGT